MNDNNSGGHVTSRREFLQHATWAAAPLASGLPAIALAQEAGASKYHAVLIDDRHVEARRFGSLLAARGAVIHAVPEGDITSLWLSTIGPAWRHAPVPIAGLTRPPVLFCLEQLAWSQGLRVIFHAEHLAATQITAPAVPGDWSVQMANVVAAHRVPAHARHAGPTSAGLAPAPTQDAQLLTSWIIAPA